MRDHLIGPMLVAIMLVGVVLCVYFIIDEIGKRRRLHRQRDLKITSEPLTSVQIKPPRKLPPKPYSDLDHERDIEHQRAVNGYGGRY